MLSSLRTMVGAVMGSLVIIGVALWFVFTDHAEMPEVRWLGVVLLLGAGAAGLIQSVGFRTPAIAPGATSEESARQARSAFQSGTFSRMALAEMPAIASIAVAFVAPEGGFVLYLLGAAIALGLLAAYVLPSDTTIARTQQSLEREGGRADLHAALGG
jgi:hypothetical protein